MIQKDYKKTTIESYNKNAEELSKKFKNFFDLQRRKEFGKFIDMIPGNKVLDLGCGSGDHSHYFKKEGLDVVSIDLSEKMIELCREKGLDARVMDIEDLDFEEDSFDGIWSVTSLLHIPKSNIDSVIRKVHNILKEDGIFYVCVKEGEGEEFVKDKDSDTKRYFVFWKREELSKRFGKKFSLIKSGRVEIKGRVFLEYFFKKK